MDAKPPVDDPVATTLLRLRDGITAPDLLIVAVVSLDLFTWLSGRGWRDLDELADSFGLQPRPSEVMVTYLAALGLLERDGDAVRTTEGAERYLAAGSAGDLRDYFASLAGRPGCVELLDVLRTDEPAPWAGAGAAWAEELTDPAFAGRITAAMDARGRVLADGLAAGLADLPITRLLDIGGGSGIYSEAVAQRLDATATVLERAPVDAVAARLLQERGASRTDVLAGDFFESPLPTGYDAHLVSHVLHDWDEALVRRLFDSCLAALPPGGLLIDFDVHIDDDRCGPLAAAEYSVFLMAATKGRCWSVAELGSFAQDSGFVAHSRRPATGDRSIAVFQKPGS